MGSSPPTAFPAVRRSRRVIRRVTWVVLALILLGWAVPLVVRVNHWKREIASAVAATVHRPVETGDIHLTLLGGLGFEIENVTVAEDPQFGYEPFARIAVLDARLSLHSLWAGRFEFSSLTLENPSINVVRNEQGRLNLETLWRPGAPGAHGQHSALLARGLPPASDIHIEDGRINFKSENEKRAFRIDDFNMDLAPPATPADPWSFRLGAIPARADLRLPSSSRFEAQGEFGPVGSAIEQEVGIPLRASWKSDQASAEDLLGLFLGRDFGVRANVLLAGRLVGTTSLLRLSATATIDNIHRWDLPPPAADLPGGITVTAAGILDRSDQSLELPALQVLLGDGSLSVHGRLENLGGGVHPELDATLARLPLQETAELVRRFVPGWGSKVRVAGVADGSIQTTGSFDALSGRIQIHDGGLYVQGDGLPARRIRFSDFPIVFQGKGGALGPLDAQLERNASVHASGVWNTGNGLAELHLSGKALAPSVLYGWARLWGAWPAAPGWAEPDAQRGSLDAQLDLTKRRGQPLQLTGWSRISDAAFHLPHLTQPLVISAGRIQFLSNQIKIQPLAITLGPLAASGSVMVSPVLLRQHSPGSGNAPLEFRLSSPLVDLSALASLIAPQPQSTFSWLTGAQAPALSLRGWPAMQGFFATADLRGGGLRWKNIAGSVSLRNQRVEFRGLSAELAGGTQRSSGAVSFGGDLPEIAWESRYANLDLQQLTASRPGWSGRFAGKISGNLRLYSMGRTWSEIVSHLRGAGEAAGRGVSIQGVDLGGSPDDASGLEPGATHLASFTSTFQLAQGLIRIGQMSAVPVPPGGEPEQKAAPPNWWIAGTVGPQGSLNLVVQPSEGQGISSRIAGTLAAPQVSRLDALAKPGRSGASMARR